MRTGCAQTVVNWHQIMAFRNGRAIWQRLPIRSSGIHWGNNPLQEQRKKGNYWKN